MAAAKTPSTVTAYSMGSLTLKRAVFSDIDDGDTWASGMDGVVDMWFNRTDDPTQTKEALGVSVSSGTFTFNAPEANCTGTLFVLQAGV